MFGGYISQGVLQSNQQKTIQALPSKALKASEAKTVPPDGLDIGRVEGDDEIFALKKFSSDIKSEFKDESEDKLKIKKSSHGEEEKTRKTKEEIKHSGENSLRKLENYGGFLCEENDDGSIKACKVTSGSNIKGDLTPAFLTGGKGELPSAEAAIITAQTIVEKELADRGKDKYTKLKECPSSSKVISIMEKFDNTLADIVVKNEPLLMTVEE